MVAAVAAPASAPASARTYPADSREPERRSESCTFIWQPNVRTSYVRARPSAATAALEGAIKVGAADGEVMIVPFYDPAAAPAPRPPAREPRLRETTAQGSGLRTQGSGLEAHSAHGGPVELVERTPGDLE